MGKSEKKDKKAKVEKVDKEEVAEIDEVDYETRIKSLCAIAHPLANKKLYKKTLKVVKKASKKKSIKRGVKEVVKGLRKGVKGIVLIAGDISPIDVISHLPVLCEDNDVPYVYVPSKEELGSAGSTKRPTSVLMIVVDAKAEYKDAYDEILSEIKELNEKMFTTI